MPHKIATFGAGCFWGVEAAFRKVRGVVDTEVGYAGGHVESPGYWDVCSGRTGHAEVVRVVYDPDQVEYADLLETFWSVHDPTMKEKTQYRSVIFSHDDEQRAAAEAAITRLEDTGAYRRPVLTAIEPAPPFYRAEEYHQCYLAKHGVA
jgi:peptide-methionine (S)-S-oxide reductase